MVDSLSQKYEEEGSLPSLSLPIPNCLMESHQEWRTNDVIIHLIHKIQEDLNPPHMETIYLQL